MGTHMDFWTLDFMLGLNLTGNTAKTTLSQGFSGIKWYKISKYSHFVVFLVTFQPSMIYPIVSVCQFPMKTGPYVQWSISVQAW